jgi:Uma2 family endonuclease
MTLAVEAVPEAPVFPPESIKRFTVDEYHKLIDAGAFNDHEPVELLEGWILYQVGHDPSHDAAVKLVSQWIDRASPDRTHSRARAAVTLPNFSEPIPDVAIVRGEVRDYAERHPGPADIFLAIEVANLSLHRDRTEKAPVYAQAGIPVYWIVNLPERAVEVYSNPTPGKYPPATRFGVGDSVPLVVGGQTLPPIPVSEILP